MVRRKTKNRTRLKNKKGIGAKVNDAWIGFVCLKCEFLNVLSIGRQLLTTKQSDRSQKWSCRKCKYIHSKESSLPFTEWPAEYTDQNSIKCQRFWEGFFRIATENPDAYWKQCNKCGRVLPANAFSRHKGWGPLERQMECRSCKGAINAYLNPRRTKQQLHESTVRRRVGDLLLEGENQTINIDELFVRFGSKCFKTGKPLKKQNRKSWAIDHILPSRYLYPLTKENAALLGRDANNNKRDRWPSRFYTNNELIKLAQITEADLGLLSLKEPIINKNISVNNCVARYLKIRKRSNLSKRVRELKKLLEDYRLVRQLSSKNKKILGY